MPCPVGSILNKNTMTSNMANKYQYSVMNSIYIVSRVKVGLTLNCTPITSPVTLYQPMVNVKLSA